MPIKTDRRDAEGMARLFHLGWFRPVHCKSVSAQEVRAVPNARKAVRQGFIALAMLLRGLLRTFGLKVGTISRGRFGQRIRELAAGNQRLANPCFGQDLHSGRNWRGWNAMSDNSPRRILLVGA